MEKLDATNDNVSHASGLKLKSRAGNSKRSRGEINLLLFCLLLFTLLGRPSV